MSPSPVVVESVRGRRANRAFSDLPFAVYRSDPRWVPPLRAEERRTWTGGRRASLKSRTVKRFVARQDGTCAGRIACIVDREFGRRWGRDTGFFGYFECMPNEAVSRALLARAEDALRAEGMRHVVGPINLTTHDELGLLVDGFELRPTILSPYNPPYYVTFLQAAGYAPAHEYHAFEWSATSAPDRRIERLNRWASRGRGRLDGLVLREADPRAWDAESRTLFELFNASFADRWGFVPLSWDEYREKAKRFRPFYRPELAIFAEVDGRPVGFGLALPDINEALALVDGRLLPFGWLRLKRELPRIRSARLILLAVRPEYAGAGIGALIAARLHAAGVRLGLERGELSLIEVTNRPMIRVVEAFGCPRIRTFQLFEKSLD